MTTLGALRGRLCDLLTDGIGQLDGAIAAHDAACAGDDDNEIDLSGARCVDLAEQVDSLRDALAATRDGDQDRDVGPDLARAVAWPVLESLRPDDGPALCLVLTNPEWVNPDLILWDDVASLGQEEDE